MNKVIARGKIARIYENLRLVNPDDGEEFITGVSCVTISVPKDKSAGFVPQEKVEDNNENNNIQFYFTGKNAVKSKEFNSGDYVEAEGIIVTRYTKDKGEKKKPEQRIFANDVRLLRSEMSEVFDASLGGGFDLTNTIYISGEIVFISNRGFINIGIRPEGQKSVILLTYFTKNRAAFIKHYKVGDFVYAKCEVQSSVKENEGKHQYIERIIVQYIDKDYSRYMKTTSYGQPRRLGKGLLR